VNYYNYHIGDFNNATRHLTRVERSLYRDLIDVYYDTEQPLNGCDFDRLAKKVLANSDEEKKALKDVLDEFFTLCDDHYHNERCDKEIAKWKGRGWFPATEESARPGIDEWKATRLRIFERDAFTCRYCGAVGGKLECDHIEPVSLGGSNDDENLATACKPCNRKKSNKPLYVFLGERM